MENGTLIFGEGVETKVREGEKNIGYPKGFSSAIRIYINYLFSEV